MKKIILSLSATLLIFNLNAQDVKDSLWTFTGVGSLNFSQLSLSNWAAGGENSFAANGLVNISANYKSLDEKSSWTNELSLGYGLLRQGDEPYRKSDDKIDFASKFGYKASKVWDYSGLLSFKTQFTKGYSKPGEEDSPVISNLMAPGYLNLSFGMDYKPSKTFTLLLSPVTAKVTFVMDQNLADAGAFGVEPGKNVRSEFGGYVKIAYAKEILKNVKLNTKIDLFSNYLDNPEKVDVNFDLLLTFKVNEYISASFITQMIYDYDIKFAILDANGEPTGETEPRLQLKELFGIGLTYSF